MQKNLSKKIPFVAKATMTTALEYRGEVTLQDLVDNNYLEVSKTDDQKAVLDALYQFSKSLDGGLFVEPSHYSGSWSIDEVDSPLKELS
ncbi:hypothetical protein TUMSATVNIG1_61180 (plasmid) [Vibrio nigripulchritudo]|uniref:hypothetical protein n=1 Tax=Vibrio nigripulchritudo TaxID=28173 RepID=UPI00190CF145|nr:hypothetical protein [Vibrio nigripulchritudo]BCL74134.1 hypothetical protein VNTUMSATTG_60710 [Vibrio nigripulchritudo]BDU35509.1 hypothetical protein TUMSATVNIG1_61180 [Vibrio nigripulchritudo]